MKRRAGSWLLLAVLGLSGSACDPEEAWYTSEVAITRLDVVRKDNATGKTLTLDVEVSYEQCPGSQYEVARGGVEFGACMAKYKVGDRVTAKVRWFKGDYGYYESKIHQLGDCERVPDPHDEASFTVVRDCEDWTVSGTKSGFRCFYLDKHKLNEACPWFKKR
jgi:hypothetical protein